MLATKFNFLHFATYMYAYEGNAPNFYNIVQCIYKSFKLINLPGLSLGDISSMLQREKNRKKNNKGT